MALEFLRRTRTPIALTLSLLALFFLIPLTVSDSCAEDVQLPQREWERRTHCNGDPDEPEPCVVRNAINCESEEVFFLLVVQVVLTIGTI